MVMRGDGGATDLAGFRRGARRARSTPDRRRRSPARCATRGVADGVVVEVGGTSTNVAAIRRRPAGAVLRAGRPATPPRCGRSTCGSSASPAGRCCGSAEARSTASARAAPTSPACRTRAFAIPADLAGARPIEIAPRPGDPADYLVVEVADGTALALTNTCAANLLGIVQPGDYAAGRRGGRPAGLRGRGSPTLRLAPGGGRPAHARGVGERRRRARRPGRARARDRRGHDRRRRWWRRRARRAVAARSGSSAIVPPDAEVISSIGDALSLVRARAEITIEDPTPADFDALGASGGAGGDESDAAPSNARPPHRLRGRTPHVARRRHGRDRPRPGARCSGANRCSAPRSKRCSVISIPARSRPSVPTGSAGVATRDRARPLRRPRARRDRGDHRRRSGPRRRAPRRPHRRRAPTRARSRPHPDRTRSVGRVRYPAVGRTNLWSPRSPNRARWQSSERAKDGDVHTSRSQASAPAPLDRHVGDRRPRHRRGSWVTPPRQRSRTRCRPARRRGHGRPAPGPPDRVLEAAVGQQAVREGRRRRRCPQQATAAGSTTINAPWITPTQIDDVHHADRRSAHRRAQSGVGSRLPTQPRPGDQRHHQRVFGA